MLVSACDGVQHLVTAKQQLCRVAICTNGPCHLEMLANSNSLSYTSYLPCQLSSNCFPMKRTDLIRLALGQPSIQGQGVLT